jgi:hypothetical protein
MRSQPLNCVNALPLLYYHKEFMTAELFFSLHFQDSFCVHYFMSHNINVFSVNIEFAINIHPHGIVYECMSMCDAVEENYQYLWYKIECGETTCCYLCG